MHYEFISYPEELARNLYEEGKKKALALLKEYGVDDVDVDGVMVKNGKTATCGLLVTKDGERFFYPFFDEGEGAELEGVTLVIDGEVIGEGEPPLRSCFAEEAFRCFDVVKVVEG